MAEHKSSLTPLGEIVDKLFRGGGLPFDIQDAKVWQVWDEVVGMLVSNHAKPLWIKNRLLRVKVCDPIWLQELRFQEEEIREKLNRRLGKQAVDKIEFRMEP
jgi:predicted nucleic acid-binding Zn ribbon protein